MYEIYLLGEVLNLEPYKYKQSSGLRGKVWTTISDNLKSNTQHEFKVSQRSCREKFQKVMDEFNKTCNEEDRELLGLMLIMMNISSCVKTSKREYKMLVKKWRKKNKTKRRRKL